MEIIDYLWGVAFAEQNLLQQMLQVNKPIFVGLGKYDYITHSQSSRR